MKRGLALSFLLLVLSCARTTISAEEWRAMPKDDRVLYVRTLIGAEKAKDAKGGGGKTYARDAQEYVNAIDEAYARGDARQPHEIFEELGR
ncbi:MAG TPA: hypothetical protein VND45_06920 [Thermoanaerobaculia bacterium]|nr:hypothetical protein [Thermoanaerobaculia bacterium]